VDLFMGGGGIMANKTPSPVEIINDRDRQLITTYRVVVEQEEALLSKPWINSRELFNECRQILDDPVENHTPVDVAWAFLLLGQVGFAGLSPQTVRTWSTSIVGGDKATQRLLTLPARIKAWRGRLKGVRIECADWKTVFRLYDSPDTLHYGDPPYHPAVCRSDLYTHRFSIQQHADLLATMNRAQGRVMLSGYDHPLYASYLFWWRRVEFPTTAKLANAGHAPRTEVAWMNYTEDGEKISRSAIVQAYIAVMGGITLAQRYLDRVKKLLVLGRPSAVVPTVANLKLAIARRFVEQMGGIELAQDWLDRARVPVAEQVA
jgi:DNA adenine methylase